MSSSTPRNTLPHQGGAEEAERLLVEHAKTDPLAFGRLFDTYYDLILGYIVNRTADVYIAQELTSNVFYSAMKNMGRFRWRRIPFSAWLYRIATNEVNGHYRRQARFQTVDIDDTADTHLSDPAGSVDTEIIEAQDAVAQKKLFLELHAAISELDPKYQDVIALHYFEGKPLEEMKVILGKPVGSLKSLLHRGRAQLQARLKNSYLKLVE